MVFKVLRVEGWGSGYVDLTSVVVFVDLELAVYGSRVQEWFAFDREIWGVKQGEKALRKRRTHGTL